MTHCLTHQMEEDQATPFGPMCPCCKLRLYAIPPTGRLRGFWESQPAAYTLRRQPLFVFSLMWDDFRIRSLHPAGSLEDPRGAIAREYELSKREREEREAAALAKRFVPLAESPPPESAFHDDDLLTPEEIEALLRPVDSGDEPRGDDRVPNDFRRGGFESMNFDPTGDVGSIEISSEADFNPFADDEDDEPDEKWLDLPDPESWLDIDWQSEGNDDKPPA